MEQKGTLITKRLTEEQWNERVPIVSLDLPVYAYFSFKNILSVSIFQSFIKRMGRSEK